MIIKVNDKLADVAEGRKEKCLLSLMVNCSRKLFHLIDIFIRITWGPSHFDCFIKRISADSTSMLEHSWFQIHRRLPSALDGKIHNLLLLCHPPFHHSLTFFFSHSAVVIKNEIPSFFTQASINPLEDVWEANAKSWNTNQQQLAWLLSGWEVCNSTSVIISKAKRKCELVA